ncbi:MAG: hypothetical protein AB8I08_33615 [Sandaracinaceae bacterium]
MGVLIVLMGCDEKAAPRRQAVETPVVEPSAAAYEIVEFDDGGSVAGSVRWTGDRPEVGTLPVRLHADVCGQTQPAPTLTISERGRIRDVVVALTDVRRGRAGSEEEAPFEMARQGCRFAPHVVARRVGQSLRFTNLDAVMHNVRARRGARAVFDLGLPEAGAAVTRTLHEAGVLRVVCDVGHTWELGWVHVFEHPYFAVTNESGQFRIEDVPPGRYTIQVWHEGWREVGGESGRPVYSSPVVLTRTVSVLPREETRLSFELSQQAAELAGD